MNYKVKTPCEKLFSWCYGDKARIYASKDAAEQRCKELNEAKDQDQGLRGTFSFIETSEEPD